MILQSLYFSFCMVKAFSGHFILSTGCSKCKKEFPREHFGDRPDFSGFNDSAWEQRSCKTHKDIGELWNNAKTQTERDELERASGGRYSELFRLPYFDPIRFHCIDPMHNLFLGTAKHIFKVWIEKGILTDKILAEIDSRMTFIKIPSDLNRIPDRISKCYKRFKADEWKHWTLVYSLFCLKDLIPTDQYAMRSVFVASCNILCQRSI